VGSHDLEQGLLERIRVRRSYHQQRGRRKRKASGAPRLEHRLYHDMNSDRRRVKVLNTKAPKASWPDSLSILSSGKMRHTSCGPLA
jgi:hypothetical protein